MKEKYVEKIYDLAIESYNIDEIPVGAIVVRNGEIIGTEINAIEAACNVVGDWRLDGCEMYVTLLPCMMCSGAILESRIDKVYYLCDRTNVCFETKRYLNVEKIDNEKMKEKYLKLLQLFFENKRN